MTDLNTFIKLRYGEPTDPGYIDRIPESIIIKVYRDNFLRTYGFNTVKDDHEIVQHVRSDFIHFASHPATCRKFSMAIMYNLIHYHQND